MHQIIDDWLTFLQLVLEVWLDCLELSTPIDQILEEPVINQVIFIVVGLEARWLHEVQFLLTRVEKRKRV